MNNDIVPLKRNCKIIPVTATVISEVPLKILHDKNNYPVDIQVNADTQSFTYAGVVIGYVAIYVKDDRVYIGTSKCNPEDLGNFSSKKGRRIAYRRMKINMNEDVVMDFDHVAELINHEHYHDVYMEIAKTLPIFDYVNVTYYPTDDFLEVVDANLEGWVTNNDLRESILGTFGEVLYDFE